MNLNLENLEQTFHNLTNLAPKWFNSGVPKATGSDNEIVIYNYAVSALLDSTNILSNHLKIRETPSRVGRGKHCHQRW